MLYVASAAGVVMLLPYVYESLNISNYLIEVPILIETESDVKALTHLRVNINKSFLLLTFQD